MLRILTEEKVKQNDDKGWEKITPGCLFYFFRGADDRRHYLAVEKFSEEEWIVIEFTPENKRRIIASLPVDRNKLHRNEVHCLNLQEKK